jgi:hypothetical protein
MLTGTAYLLRLVYNGGHTNHAISLRPVRRVDVGSLLDLYFAGHNALDCEDCREFV